MTSSKILTEALKRLTHTYSWYFQCIFEMYFISIFQRNLCAYLASYTFHFLSCMIEHFCICSGILLYRWYFIQNGKGEKKTCQISFQPIFLYILWICNSPKWFKNRNGILGSFFFLSAAHFIFNVWARHLSFTQWSGTGLPWLVESKTAPWQNVYVCP